MKNEYSRDVPKKIQEMEDEILSFLSENPRDLEICGDGGQNERLDRG